VTGWRGDKRSAGGGINVCRLFSDHSFVKMSDFERAIADSIRRLPHATLSAGVFPASPSARARTIGRGFCPPLVRLRMERASRERASIHRWRWSGYPPSFRLFTRPPGGSSAGSNVYGHRELTRADLSRRRRRAANESRSRHFRENLRVDSPLRESRHRRSSGGGEAAGWALERR